MDGWVPLAVALLVGLLLGGGAAWLIGRARAEVAIARIAGLQAQLDAAASERDRARERADQVWADREAMVNEFKVLSHETLESQGRRADESAELRLRATEQLLRPVRESLETFNRRLAEVESQRAGLAADLSAQVQSVRATGEELRRETAALATALRKPHVRGAWGELQLRRVAELAGMLEHCDFETQQTSAGPHERGIRPDMTVTLSGGRVLYVDSKVPLASFLDAAAETDERIRADKLAGFGRNVRTHIDQLSAKDYFKAGPASPEFVVLFLPSEALASEALSLLPDLHEYAARRCIVLATPTTLIAMLRAVAYGWRQAALADSASEVFALGRELYDRLGTLGEHVDKLGRALNGTVRAYNVALGSLEGRVLVTGRRFRDLQLTEADLVAPAVVEEVARPVTAAELVASASTLPELDELRRGQPSLDAWLAEAETDVSPPSAGGGRAAG